MVTMADQKRSYHKLEHNEQQFILQSLAEDHGPAYVATLVFDTFGKEITRQVIHQYSKRYEKEISDIRRKINSDIANVPISNKIVRQRRREHIFQLYLREKKYPQALSVLDDIDKLEAPVAQDKSGIHIGISNTNNASAITQLSDQELDELARGIIKRRETVHS